MVVFPRADPIQMPFSVFPPFGVLVFESVGVAVVGAEPNLNFHEPDTVVEHDIAPVVLAMDFELLAHLVADQKGLAVD